MISPSDTHFRIGMNCNTSQTPPLPVPRPPRPWPDHRRYATVVNPTHRTGDRVRYFSTRSAKAGGFARYSSRVATARRLAIHVSGGTSRCYRISESATLRAQARRSVSRPSTKSGARPGTTICLDTLRTLAVRPSGGITTGCNRPMAGKSTTFCPSPKAAQTTLATSSRFTGGTTSARGPVRSPWLTAP